MANLKDIKNRIKGVKSTQKITKAMKMISTARLNKAKIALGIILEYSRSMENFVNSLIGTVDLHAIESNMPMINNIVNSNAPKKRMTILFTTDKGLCGALNTLILRAFENSVSNQDVIYILGKKGFDYCKTRHKIYNTHPVLSSKCDFSEIAEEISYAITKEGITDLNVVFPHFVSTMVQKPSNINLPHLAQQKQGNPSQGAFFQVDECPAKLLENSIKHYIEAMLSSCLAELICCEHSARMIAMDNATNNAKTKIAALTLTYNKTRQANITREILEIISGSQAV